jgi:hypothetical protein
MRKLVLFSILLNFCLTVCFGNFFYLEPGISAAPIDEAKVANTNDLPLEVISLVDSSKLGSLPGLFLEGYNSAWGDALNYMSISLGKESVPPYTMRPLVPKVVGFVTKPVAALMDGENVTNTQINLLNPTLTFINLVCLMLSVIVLFRIIFDITQDELISGALSIGLVVNIGTLQTAQFFMLDVLSYCASVMILYFFVKERYFQLAVIIAFSVLVKEILIIYSVLLVKPILEGQLKLKFIIYIITPLIVFVAFRYFENVDPLSVGYSWEISQGEFRLRYLRLHAGSFKSLIGFFLRLFLTFGFLWAVLFYSVRYIKRIDILLSILLILGAILADLILASRVPRVIFVVYPAIVLLTSKMLAPNRGLSE